MKELFLCYIRLKDTSDKKNNEDKAEYQKMRNKISLWKDDKIHIVDVNDIYYCEARERYTHIFTKDEEYEIREGISEVEKTINHNSFFRSHQILFSKFRKNRRNNTLV